jgi:hypothetical protein
MADERAGACSATADSSTADSAAPCAASSIGGGELFGFDLRNSKGASCVVAAAMGRQIYHMPRKNGE